VVRRIRTARESCYASPCPNTAYKLYYDGRAEQAINLRCSERGAKKRARKLATEGPVELWEGSRAIARYEASGTARARGLFRLANDSVRRIGDLPSGSGGLSNA
jgi:hypothetical protein